MREMVGEQAANGNRAGNKFRLVVSSSGRIEVQQHSH
jgi:hypothetical protein